MGISPSISDANWLAGFCIVRVFTERYFLKRLFSIGFLYSFVVFKKMKNNSVGTNI